MNIPLLNKEDVEKEGEDIGEPIRDEIIEILKCKGYTYAPAEEEFEDETIDFFTKEGQLIQVIINEEIPEEVLEYMMRLEKEGKIEKEGGVEIGKV